MAALRRHHHEQRQEQLRAGAAWEGRTWDLDFTEADGTPLRPYDPLFALKPLARKAGVPVLALHDLRHTAATVAMTLDLYGHVLTLDNQAAADVVGRAVGRLGAVAD